MTIIEESLPLPRARSPGWRAAMGTMQKVEMPGWLWTVLGACVGALLMAAGGAIAWSQSYGREQGDTAAVLRELATGQRQMTSDLSQMRGSIETMGRNYVAVSGDIQALRDRLAKAESDIATLLVWYATVDKKLAVIEDRKERWFREEVAQ